MDITIELYSGKGLNPRKKDIDRNIQALENVLSGKKRACDDGLIIDTTSILNGIKQKLEH